MGWACNAYGGEERRIEGFGGEIRGKKYHLEDPGVDGRIILRWIFRKCVVGVWTGSSLAQDRDRWQALVRGIS